MSEKALCSACKRNPVPEEGQACVPCASLALRAYGWANGAVVGGQLRRGPRDEAAWKELYGEEE